MFLTLTHARIALLAPGCRARTTCPVIAVFPPAQPGSNPTVLTNAHLVGPWPSADLLPADSSTLSFAPPTMPRRVTDRARHPITFVDRQGTVWAFTWEARGAWGTARLHWDSGCSCRDSSCTHTGRTLEAGDAQTVRPGPCPRGEPARQPVLSQNSGDGMSPWDLERGLGGGARDGEHRCHLRSRGAQGQAVSCRCAPVTPPRLPLGQGPPSGPLGAHPCCWRKAALRPGCGAALRGSWPRRGRWSRAGHPCRPGGRNP